MACTIFLLLLLFFLLLHVTHSCGIPAPAESVEGPLYQVAVEERMIGFHRRPLFQQHHRRHDRQRHISKHSDQVVGRHKNKGALIALLPYHRHHHR